jgi:ubiquinone/menaquinone biosynthesis C-methylase UbiE
MTQTGRVRAIYDRSAPKYDKRIAFFERILFAGGREWVCSRAAGDVLEIAVGTGRNLTLYPPGVRLTGVELSPAMLEIARARARSHGIEADLRVGDAQALEMPDAAFDSVVVTLALCTIPDDRKAVAEIARVLRPGGRVLLLEHVRSPLRVVRLGQRLLEPLALRFEGDHLTRDPLDHLRGAGFVVKEIVRSKAGIVELVAATKRTEPQPSL